MTRHPTKHLRRRGRWVTAAAAVLVVYGGLGLLYAPMLEGWTFLGVGISALTFLGLLGIATGIGLLRLDGWARLAAGLLAGFWLLFMYAPALMAAVSNGVWFLFDLVGVVGYLVVVFAVLRRWPADPE